MLFLADQNLRHDAFRVLVQIGFEVVHTRWLGAERFDDLALLRLAEVEQMVLLTEDRGVAATWARTFLDQHARAAPGMVVLEKLHRMEPRTRVLFAVPHLLQALVRHGDSADAWRGVIAVIDHGGLRPRGP